MGDGTVTPDTAAVQQTGTEVLALQQQAQQVDGPSCMSPPSSGELQLDYFRSWDPYADADDRGRLPGHIVMAYILMAYVVMDYLVMAVRRYRRSWPPTRSWKHGIDTRVCVCVCERVSERASARARVCTQECASTLE